MEGVEVVVVAAVAAAEAVACISSIWRPRCASAITLAYARFSSRIFTSWRREQQSERQRQHAQSTEPTVMPAIASGASVATAHSAEWRARSE